jgi:phosphoribosylformimino-5-aminoimidazole carboxamide ribotide isomerase
LKRGFSERATMLLIFPSIEISGKNCVQIIKDVKGTKRSYSVDPAEMAVLWRGENAKTMHVVDLDGLAQGKVVNSDILKRMVDAVDTPIQVGGGLRTYDEIEHVLSLGVYRIVIGTAAVEQPRLIERLIKTFGTRKIAIGIDVKDGKVLIDSGKREIDISPLQLAKDMKSLGVCRIVYRERSGDDQKSILPIKSLQTLATETNIRVTCWGGVESFKDLVKLQNIEKFGVDSVIVGKPLYENKFPCQALWRINEEHLTELGPTRRI